MPTHIHHSGIDALRARYNGTRVWLLRDKHRDLGIARKLGCNDWMHWKDFAAMKEGEARCWWHARKLETIMGLLAQENPANRRKKK